MKRAKIAGNATSIREIDDSARIVRCERGRCDVHEERGGPTLRGTRAERQVPAGASLSLSGAAATEVADSAITALAPALRPRGRA